MNEDFFSTVKEIIKYGGSTFAALVVTSVYMMTDGFFIGNFVGTEALAAMALIYPVVMIFIALRFLKQEAVRLFLKKSVRIKKILLKKLCVQIMSSHLFLE